MGGMGACGAEDVKVRRRLCRDCACAVWLGRSMLGAGFPRSRVSAPAHAIAAVQAPLPTTLDVWSAPGATLTISYAFESAQSGEFLRPYTGWAAWTADEKAAVRKALDEYESVINVRFVEVAAGASDPVIAFGRVDVASVAETWWALWLGPDAAGQQAIKRWDAGVVFDNSRDLTDPNAQWLILHEIGHALLMKHTGEYDTTGKLTPPPHLPAGEDNRDHTVMSYIREDGAAVALQLQVYDIAALQARWGANTTEAGGDNVYALGAEAGIVALWDTGGVDRIDASAATGPAQIDLAEGAFSQLDGQSRVSIAWGVLIEDATGSAFGDRIAGNALDNRLLGGAGGDTIEGGAGLNFLRGEEGDDVIVGGAGFDDAHGNMGDDTVHGGAGDDWVVGGKDKDWLFGDDGHDLVYGNLGDDTAEGGAGNDVVLGGQGNDVVRGGDGDDYVSGDRGDDVMSGGLGADSFHGFVGMGRDVVTDFSRAQGDVVRLDAGTAYAVAQVGGDVVITIGDAGAGESLTLQGIAMAALSGDWIVRL